MREPWRRLCSRRPQTDHPCQLCIDQCLQIASGGQSQIGTTCGNSSRIGGNTLVSSVLARSVCAVIPLFCRSAQPTIGIHGNSNAVGFPEIGGDGFFDLTGTRTTLIRGQDAPLSYRSSAAPHSNLPQRRAHCFFGAIFGIGPIISLIQRWTRRCLDYGIYFNVR